MLIKKIRVKLWTVELYQNRRSPNKPCENTETMYRTQNYGQQKFQEGVEIMIGKYSKINKIVEI